MCTDVRRFLPRILPTWLKGSFFVVATNTRHVRLESRYCKSARTRFRLYNCVRTKLIRPDARDSCQGESSHDAFPLLSRGNVALIRESIARKSSTFCNWRSPTAWFLPLYSEESREWLLDSGILYTLAWEILRCKNA